MPVPASFQLPNGLTVLVNERPGLPIVSANLVVKTGSGANPVDKPGLANFTAAMLDEGTETKSALQIADEVAQLGGSLTTSSTMDASQASASSLKRTFPEMLTLLADVVRHPNFPQEEIERQRASRLASLVQQRENANAVASDGDGGGALRSGASVRVSPSSAPSRRTRRMTRDDLQKFWSQNFVPNNAALIVSGQITVNELKPLVEKAFGDWQKGTPVGSRSRRARDDEGEARARRQARRAADAAPRGVDWRAARHAGLRGDPGDERNARRSVLEPHQPEPARGARLHLRSQLAVRVPPGAPGRFSWRPASAPT